MKTKTKRFLVLLFALAMCFGMLTTTVFAEQSDATLSSLTFTVGGNTYPVLGFTPEDSGPYEVEVPFGTLGTDVITLIGVTNADGASMNTAQATTTMDGTKQARISVQSADTMSLKLYTVNFVAAREHTISVTSGTTEFPESHNYFFGKDVEITANPAPEGKMFDRWIVASGPDVTFVDANATTTTLKMPADDVTVEATYKAIPYKLWIDGTQVSQDVLSGTNWSYDHDTKTITLSGSGDVAFSTQHEGYAIYAGEGETLNIVLDGTGTFTIDGIYNKIEPPNYAVHDVNISAAPGKTPDLVLTNTAAGKYPMNIDNMTINGIKNLTAEANSATGFFGAQLTAVVSGDVNISNTSGRIGTNANISANSIVLSCDADGVSDAGTMFSGLSATYVTLSAIGDISLSNTNGRISDPNLTITRAKNVTINGGSDSYIINQNLSISASGDVELGNPNGQIVGNATNIAGKNITATGDSAEPLFSAGHTTLRANGDILLTNMSGKIAGSDFSITKAQNVTIEGDANNNYLMETKLSISASGDVELENLTGAIAQSDTDISGVNISVFGDKATPLFSYPATFGAIGDIDITNSNGSIAGKGLTITKATNVTISGNTNGKLIETGALSVDAKNTIKLINNMAGAGNSVTGSELCVKSTNETLGTGTSSIIKALYSNASVEVSVNSDGTSAVPWDGTDASTYKYLEVKRTAASVSASEGGSKPTYGITTQTSENGTLKLNRSSAKSGEEIIITIKPDKGYTLETLTVTDKKGKPIDLVLNKDGTRSFTMPTGRVEIKATFMEDNTMLNFFVDVPASAYYYDAVLWAVNEEITTGTSDTMFSPNESCTRAQAVTFLWRAAGCPEPARLSTFSDVSGGTYYAKAVAWAAEQGITGGTSENTFSPEATCNRAQIVAFLYRMNAKDTLNIKDNPFSDIAEGNYYYDAVLWAAENGITGGTSTTTFSPSDSCTRAQIVTFLYRFFEN